MPPGDPEKPLLLIGTGSGLAPLYGIIQDALHQGHKGPISLFHGSSHPEGLYLADELQSLSARYDHCSYTPAVSRALSTTSATLGRANEIALSTHTRLSGWRVYLCGHPEMVHTTKKKAFLAGAAMREIHADPFSFVKPPSTAVAAPSLP